MPDPNSPEIPPGTAPIAGSKFGEAQAPGVPSAEIEAGLKGLSARAQVVTMGRIVTAQMVTPAGRALWPAIVTRVWNPDMVNLNVFTDAGVIVATSVPQKYSHEAGYAGTTWDWPVRV